MSLARHWIGSPNYSTGGPAKRLLVLHTTEGFTGPNGMYDCGYYFQGNVGASSDVIIDNYHPGHIVEGVAPQHNAWTQCNYNGHTAASVEQCGYASWSRNTWLNDKMPLLENVAAWLAEESNRWDIPLTELNESQSQGSGRGVTYHMRLGSAGCGHSDPGSGYPLDVVLDLARGGTAPVPPETIIPVDEEDDLNGHIGPAGTPEASVNLVWTPKGKYEILYLFRGQSEANYSVYCRFLSDGGWSTSRQTFSDNLTHAIHIPHHETCRAVSMTLESGQGPVGFFLEK